MADWHAQPIPPDCGVYYFEVEVLSKGRDGFIGVGLSGASVNLGRLPGWEKCVSACRALASYALPRHKPLAMHLTQSMHAVERRHSFGYHGDDGQSFEGHGTGRYARPHAASSHAPSGGVLAS